MPVTLIYGSNVYTAEEHYKELIEKFVRENSPESLHVFDGESAAANDVTIAASSQSLFGGTDELIAIRSLGSNTELKDALIEIIESLPSDTQLIIFEPKIDKRSRLFKLLKKSHDSVEFTNLTDAELNNWIAQKVELRGGTIQPGASRMIASRTKNDMLRISNELNKLLNYDKNITQEVVKLLIDESPDDNIFELLNLVASNNKPKALEKLSELLDAQIEPHYILVMIAWQASNMLAVKTAKGAGDSEIASKLSMNPYAVSRTKSAIRNIDQRQLEKMCEKVRDADVKTKTTSVDVVQVIKQLIAEL